ncbi:MAG: EamA family transporter [Acidimicrobiales bacterium]
MIAVALAALSALSYGASDFSGAMASRDNEATVVTVAMQLVSLVALAVVIVLYPPAAWTMPDMLWGALGGLGAALGLVTFYRALAIGPMTVAAALTALWSTAVPVVAGFLLGERPAGITMVGIAIAVPAAMLVSLDLDGDTSAEPRIDQAADVAVSSRPQLRWWPTTDRWQTRTLAIVAGCGFGLFFVALSRTSAEAGLLPLVGARIASIAALGYAIHRFGSVLKPAAAGWWLLIVVAGILDFVANATYLVAVRNGSLTWVAAISSLYPVSTVLLARIVLDERLAKVQLWGLGASGLALVLVGIGAGG